MMCHKFVEINQEYIALPLTAPKTLKEALDLGCAPWQRAAFARMRMWRLTP